jgi:hypothetical protein
MPPSHPRPWHRNSVFGDGRRRPLDREQRARIRFLLNAHARANRLPAKQEKVGRALLKRLGTAGQCDPSHDTLAMDTGVSSRTVRRATATMHDLGLLRWQTRLVRAEWRTEQTSNAYELVPTAENPAVCCGGQIGRETRRKDFKTIANGPSEGSDEWGRWNRDRQLSSVFRVLAITPPRTPPGPTNYRCSSRPRACGRICRSAPGRPPRRHACHSRTSARLHFQPAPPRCVMPFVGIVARLLVDALHLYVGHRPDLLSMTALRTRPGPSITIGALTGVGQQKSHIEI